MQLLMPADVAEAPADEMERVQVGQEQDGTGQRHASFFFKIFKLATCLLAIIIPGAR